MVFHLVYTITVPFNYLNWFFIVHLKLPIVSFHDYNLSVSFIPMPDQFFFFYV